MGMNNTERLKTEILDTISQLFGDTAAAEQDQIKALEEIKDLCDDNITALSEQLKSNDQ